MHTMAVLVSAGTTRSDIRKPRPNASVHATRLKDVGPRRRLPILPALVMVLVVWMSAFETLGQTAGTLRWQVNFATGITTPAFDTNGNIYFSTAAGYLFSLSANGTTNWVRRVASTVSSAPAGSPPAIAADGTIYFGTSIGRFYSFSKDGATNWWLNLPGFSEKNRCAAAIASDGTVYVSRGTTLSSVLLSISPSGTTNWSVPLDSGYVGVEQFSSPTIGRDGTIYIGTHAGLLYSVHPEGRTNWVYNVQHPIYSSPTIGADETIFVGGDGGSLIYAVSQDGRLKWKTPHEASNEASVVIGTNGWLYTGESTERFGAFDPQTGTNIWQTNIASSGSPAIASDGAVYAVDWQEHKLYAFSAIGSNLWTFPLPGTSFTSPTIAENGTVYVTSESWLIAVNASSPPAQTEWPMYRRDAQRQARKIQCGVDRIEFAVDKSTLLSLRMEKGLTYTLQGATDFANWSSVTQFVSHSPAAMVQDYAASNYPSRFYRLVTP